MLHEDPPVELASYQAHPPTPGGKIYCAGFEAWLEHHVRLNEVDDRLRDVYTKLRASKPTQAS